MSANPYAPPSSVPNEDVSIDWDTIPCLPGKPIAIQGRMAKGASKQFERQCVEFGAQKTGRTAWRLLNGTNLALIAVWIGFVFYMVSGGMRRPNRAFELPVDMEWSLFDAVLYSPLFAPLPMLGSGLLLLCLLWWLQKSDVDPDGEVEVFAERHTLSIRCKTIRGIPLLLKGRWGVCRFKESNDAWVVAISNLPQRVVLKSWVKTDEELSRLDTFFREVDAWARDNNSTQNLNRLPFENLPLEDSNAIVIKLQLGDHLDLHRQLKKIVPDAPFAMKSAWLANQRAIFVATTMVLAWLSVGFMMQSFLGWATFVAMVCILVYTLVVVVLFQTWLVKRMESKMSPLAFLNTTGWEEVYGSVSVTIPFDVMKRCVVGKNFAIVYTPKNASRYVLRDQCDSEEHWNQLLTLLKSIPEIECMQSDAEIVAGHHS